MSRSLRSLVHLALIAAALAPGPSSAAPPDEARQLFDDGLAAYRDGHVPEALDLMRRSYALEAVPVVLYNLAQLELQQLDYVNAGNHLYRYLETEAALTSERRLAIQRLVEDQVRPHAALIQLVGLEIGALVLVDGHPIGEAGVRHGYWTFAGPHEVALPDGTAKTVVTRVGEAVLVELHRRRDAPSTVPGYLVGGIGLACVATGAILLAAADGAASDVEQAAPATPWTDVRSSYETSRDLPTAGGVLTGIGAAATVTGLVLLIRAWSDGGDTPDDDAAVGVIATPHEAGLGLRGAF